MLRIQQQAKEIKSLLIIPVCRENAGNNERYEIILNSSKWYEENRRQGVKSWRELLLQTPN